MTQQVPRDHSECKYCCYCSHCLCDESLLKDTCKQQWKRRSKTKCAIFTTKMNHLPWPADSILLPPALWKYTVSMWVVLYTVTLLVTPLVFLIGIVKVKVAGNLFAIAEGGRSLLLVLCPLEFGLDNKMFRAPGICEVDIFQVNGLKAVFSTCATVTQRPQCQVNSGRSLFAYRYCSHL